MSENPYEVMMPSGPFGKAVDKAIAEANEQFLSDPEAQEQARADGARWAALTAAQGVAQGHGVVLPIATVEEIVKVLNGQPSKFDEINSSLLPQMVEHALAAAKVDPKEQR